MNRRTYDFDEFSAYVLNIMFNVWRLDMFARVRFSSSGNGLHIKTIVDLSKFQDCNREKWSVLYGFDITFRTKNGRRVSKWLNIGIFLSRNDTLIIKWSMERFSKYAKKETSNCKILNRRKPKVKKQIAQFFS